MINTYDPATMNTQAIRELTGEVTKLKIETKVLSEQIEDVEAEIPELPTPAAADAGKVIVVGENGKYELGEGGGGGGIANLNALIDNTLASIYFITNIEDYVPGQPAMLTIAIDQGGGHIAYTMALLGASTSISREVDKTDLTYIYIYYNNALFELPDGTYDIADLGGSFDDMFTVIVDGTYKGYVLLHGSN